MRHEEAAKILGDDIVGFGIEARIWQNSKIKQTQRTGTDEPGKFKVYVKDPKTGNVKMVRFGSKVAAKTKIPKQCVSKFQTLHVEKVSKT